MQMGLAWAARGLVSSGPIVQDSATTDNKSGEL